MPDTAASALKAISSKATQALLIDLAADYETRTGVRVALESVGGVDAAKRVAAGEAFDLVFLAADAIDKLIASGQVLAGSRVDLVRSGVSAAVPQGAPLPDFSSEAAVRAAVLAAPTLGYSTGPSGVALAKLFDRWGIAEQIAPRLLTPPPGTPVAQWVAEGRIALGFQQLSEMISVPGITLVGPLPPAIQITTIFSSGVAATSTRADEARALLAAFAAPDTADAKRRQGMEPA